MSSNVEERVVEMRFDNKKFEQNAKETMKTLDKLDKSLDLKGSTEGFERLEKAAKNLDLDAASKAVEAVTNKFSIMGTIGDQILRNLTNRAADFAINWTKAMTLDQVNKGWSKYEAKTQAVQVMLHALKDEGVTIEDVNEVLADLNTYTDNTSYHFDQMVDSMSKFTSAGIKMEDAEKMVEGIANWAASSGVSADKAGSAFYNLSQAMSSGALRAQDWKSIELLNMNSKEFEEKAIEIAQAMIDDGRASEEMARAFKKADPKVQGFRDSLSTGWLDKDVMTELFKAYADQTTDFGYSAYMAAYEAKSLTDAVEAAKESVASGWANIFEQIFGNYEEAKVFWTEVADAMIEVFSAPTNALAELLTEWHNDGGYVSFIESIRNAWAAVKGIGEAVKEVFESIFPAVGADKLVELTQNFESLTGSWRTFSSKIDIKDLMLPAKDIKALEEAGEDLSWYWANLEEAKKHNEQVDKNMQPFKETLEGIFSILNLVKTVTTALFKIALPFTKLLVPIARIVGVITSALGRLSSTIVDAILGSEWFNKAIEKLNVYAEAAADYLSGLAEKLAVFLDTFTHMPWFEAFVALLVTTWETIKAFAEPYINEASAAITEFVGNVKAFVEEHADEALKAVGDALVTFGTAAFYAGQKLIQWLIPALKTVWGEVKKVWVWMKDVGGQFVKFWKEQVVPSELYQKAKTKLGELWAKVKEFGGEFIEVLRNGGITAALEWVGEQVNGLIEKIKKVDFGELLSGLLSSTVLVKVISFILTLRKLRKALTAARTFMVSFPKAIRSFSKGLGVKRVATAILILAAALYVLSKVPAERLWDLVKAIGALALILVGFTLILAAVMKAINGKDTKLRDLAGFGKTITSLIALALAVLILAAALKVISTIDSDKLEESMLVLVEIFGMLAIASALISTGGKNILRGGLGLLAMVAAIILFISAFQKIKEIIAEVKSDLPALEALILPIVGFLAVFGLVLKAASKGKKTTWQLAAVIASLGVAMLLIAVSIGMLAKMDNTEFGKSVVILLALAGVLVVLMLIAKAFKNTDGKTFLGIAASIAALGVAILMISGSVALLGVMPKTIAEAGLKRLAVIMGLLAIVMLSMRSIKSKTGGAIWGIVGVIATVTAALIILSKQNFSKMLDSAVLLGTVMLALTVSLAIMSKSVRKTDGKSIAALALILVAIAGSLYVLSNLSDMGRLVGAALAISAVLIALGVAMRIGIKAASGGTKGQGTALLGMVGIVLAVGFALLLLKDISFGHLLGSAVIMAVLMIILGKVVNNMSKGFGTAGHSGWTGMWQSIITMFSILAFIVAALAVLKNYGLKQLVVTGAVLAVLMIVLTLCTSALSRLPKGSWKDALPIIAMFSAIIFPIVFALAVAKSLIKNTEGLVDIALAIGAICLAMMIPVAAVMLLGKAGVGLGAAAKGSFGFAIAIAVIIAAIVGIAYLIDVLETNTKKDLVSVVHRAGEVLAEVGGALGGMIGAFYSSAIETVFKSLPKIGEDIRTFCTDIAVGLTLLSIIPVNEEAIASIGTLAGAILTITEAKVLDGIRQWLGLGGEKTAVQQFADDLAEMGPSLRKFAEETSSIKSPKDVLSCALAIEALANAAESMQTILPEWLQKIVGRPEKLGEFALELVKAAPGITAFALMASGLEFFGSTSAMVNVAQALEAIVNVANNLPHEDTKAFFDQIKGVPQKLSTFAEDLSNAVPGLEKFAEAAPGIANKEGSIRSAAGALQAIVDVANSLSPENVEFGGGLGGNLFGAWFQYKRDAQTLGEFLEIFGTIDENGVLQNGITQKLADFANTFHTLTEEGKFDGIDDAITLLEDLAKIGNTLVVKETDINALFGLVNIEISEKSGLDVISQAIPGLETSLRSFINTLGGEGTMDTFKSAVDALSVLADAEVLLRDAYMSYQEESGDIGEPYHYNNTFLKDFIDEITGTVGGQPLSIDPADVQALANVFSAFNGLDFSGVHEFAEWAKNSSGDQEYIDEGKAIVASMVGAIQTAAGLILPTTADAATTEIADEFAKDVYITKFETVGAQFAQGLANGIMDNIRAVELSAATLSERTIQTMRRVLRIQSPSRVARKIGDYTGQGFYLGLEDWVKASGTAGEDLANSMTDSAIGVLDYISALMNGDLVVDMTIRPVLDLTYMQPGITSINSIFAQRQAIMADVETNSLSQRDEVAELVNVSWQILREIQNGRDLYLDGKVLAGSMNRRLGKTVMEGL